MTNIIKGKTNSGKARKNKGYSAKLISVICDMYLRATPPRNNVAR